MFVNVVKQRLHYNLCVPVHFLTAFTNMDCVFFPPPPPPLQIQQRILYKWHSELLQNIVQYNNIKYSFKQ
jgi:hypothetical protein